jgi:hypothetical protein
LFPGRESSSAGRRISWEPWWNGLPGTIARATAGARWEWGTFSSGPLPAADFNGT